MSVLRATLLLVSDSLAGWAALFTLLADFCTCEGGYRG